MPAPRGTFPSAASGPVWPFPVKNIAQQSRRVDEGWDLQYPGTTPVPIFAVESGTLGTAGPDPQGFGVSYPLLHLDQPVSGFTAIYYGHTFPDTSKVGAHVSAGETIGRTGGLHSGGNAYGLSNWLEIGFWPPSFANGPAMKAWLSGAASPPAGGVPPSPPGGLGSALRAVAARLAVLLVVVAAAGVAVVIIGMWIMSAATRMLGGDQ